MGWFSGTLKWTGAILIAPEVAQVATAGISAYSSSSEKERQAFNEGYKQGFADARDAYRIIRKDVATQRQLE